MMILPYVAGPPTYTNPVLREDAPDPGVLKAGSDYFMATTGGDRQHGAFPIYHSKDLVNWEDAGSIFAKRKTPGWASGDFWAPEIHKVGEGFVAYFTARDRSGMLRIGAATSDKVDGPYQDIGQPLVAEPNVGVIDATFFEDEDGTKYLYWKEDGNAFNPPQPTRIMGQRLEADGLTRSGEAVEVLRNDPESWEGDIVEAPELVKRGDYYFVLYSGNGYWGEDYAEGAARSKSPLGPFEKAGEPFLTSNQRWEGPGHAFLTQDRKGKDWLVYHAWDEKHEGRQVLIDPVTWGADGWPHMKGPSSGGVAPKI
ncbi:MAG: family 43 glycosylhydrolase [Candidatus Eremiobacteraeota bacterium]|nr:family 43 glycosylhydrolase [Candidatus Eremiobacteraeota bacterium]